MVSCTWCDVQVTSIMKCSRCKKSIYCSKECQKKDWPSHKGTCIDITKRENVKQELLKDYGDIDDPYISHIIDNIADRSILSTKNPVTAHPLLFDAINDTNQSFIFYTGQICSSSTIQKKREIPRFVFTVAVFTCISVFAYSSKDKFVATHIPLSSLLNGCRKNTKNPLPGLVFHLKSTFKDVTPEKVKITIIGGLKSTDKDTALQNYYPNEPDKHYFSKHIMRAIAFSGLAKANIDNDCLTKFIGSKNVLFSMEEQMRDNLHYQFISMDTNTGLVFLNTNGEKSTLSYEISQKANFYQMQQYNSAELLVTVP